MNNWHGPRSMAALCYLVLAFVLGSPFFLEGNERLDVLWDIYMSPIFDEESALILFFATLVCAALGAVYFLSPFSSRLSEWVSRHDVGRFLAGVSAALTLVAMVNFSSPLTMSLAFGAVFSFWSWRKSDPDDHWF